MNAPILSFVLASSLVVLAGSATADDLAAPQMLAADEPAVATTTSPLLLFVPMAELTTEFRVTPRFGIAAIAGIGRFRERSTNAPVSLYEGGASLRYYALGSFRKGVQLGFEAIYIHATTTSMTVNVRAAGLGVAPFVGYKWTHGSGFTLEGQIGATFMAARANAQSGSTMASEEDSKVGPMLNLQAGYSF